MLSNLKLLIWGVLFVVGLFSGGGLLSLWDRYIDDPRLVRKVTKEQEQLCLMRTREAAETAKRVEQQRQEDVANEVRRAFETQMAARRAAHSVAEHQFEQEISDYEEKLKQAGRSCALDDDTIEWLQQPPRPPNLAPG